MQCREQGSGAGTNQNWSTGSIIDMQCNQKTVYPCECAVGIPFFRYIAYQQLISWINLDWLACANNELNPVSYM